MLRLAAERREKVAHGASRGNVFSPDKLRSSERRQDSINVSSARPGDFRSIALFANSRRGLLPLLRSHLAMCLLNSKNEIRPLTLFNGRCWIFALKKNSGGPETAAACL
jgi:hypothetical protein